MSSEPEMYLAKLAFIVGVLVLTVLARAVFNSNLIIEPHQSIVLLGDNISAPGGYGPIMQDLIDRRYPGRAIRVIAGSDFDRDVVADRPHWVIVHFGIDEASGSTAEQLIQSYEAVINRALRDSTAKLVIVSPLYPDRDGESARLKAAVAALKELAAKHNLLYIPLYEATREFHKAMPAGVKYAPDGLHANLLGNWMIAQTILSSLDFPFLIDPYKIQLPARAAAADRSDTLAGKKFRLTVATPLDVLLTDAAVPPKPPVPATQPIAAEDLTSVGVYHLVPPPTPEAELARCQLLERELDVLVLDISEARTFVEPDTAKTLPYRLFKPANWDHSKHYPLVLYLHHAGISGHDNAKQVVCSSGVGLFMLPEHQAQFPCFVLAPQAPGRWADMNWNTSTSTRKPEPNDAMRMALEITDAVCKEFAIAPTRIYVTGTSMGSFGTWEAVSRRPHFFAAAVASSGGYDENAASLFLDTPIWAFHGNDDEIINVDRTRHMVDAIRQTGGKIRYWEFPGMPHEIARDVVYSNPEVLTWMFAQQRRGGTERN